MESELTIKRRGCKISVAVKNCLSRSHESRSIPNPVERGARIRSVTSNVVDLAVSRGISTTRLRVALILFFCHTITAIMSRER